MTVAAGAPPKLAGQAAADPGAYWISEGVSPGDVAMMYGDGLSGARLWPLANGPAGVPGDSSLVAPSGAAGAEIIQGSPQCLKFRIPASFAQGIFGVQAGSAAPLLVNAPEIWFLQPTTLRPGLNANEAPAGAEVHIVGKSFLLPDDSGHAAAMARPAGAGSWISLRVVSAERYSMMLELPQSLVEGEYELAVHNGSGGSAAWSPALTFRIRKPEEWPSTVFHVKQFGAAGDDVRDDTEAIRKALVAAEANGGGIVEFPYGVYRLKGYLVIPERTVLRGAGRDITVLKWPVDEPKKPEDFTQAAMYGAVLAGNRFDDVEEPLAVPNRQQTVIIRD